MVPAIVMSLVFSGSVVSEFGERTTNAASVPDSMLPSGSCSKCLCAASMVEDATASGAARTARA